MSYFDGKELFNQPKVQQHASHMIMSNVYKEEKESFLTIDTTFCTNKDLKENSSVFDIKLHAPINDIKSISVVSASIPLSWNNISKNFKNSYFKFNNITYIIPDNEYNESTLISYLNNELTGVLSFSINSDKNKLEITSNVDGKLEFDIDEKGYKDKFNLKSKLGYILGFREEEYELVANGKLVAEKYLDLDKKYDAFLNIEDFSTGYSSNYTMAKQEGTTKSNVLAKFILIPPSDKINQYINDKPEIFRNHKFKTNVNKASGNLISGTRVYSGKTSLQKFRINLSDEFGNVIDLNGLDFSVDLLIKHL
tara:strand:+ start:1652 stop:2578 length:927 start_codon:yes stop_codon:yes gene_type:complete